MPSGREQAVRVFKFHLISEARRQARRHHIRTLLVFGIEGEEGAADLARRGVAALVQKIAPRPQLSTFSPQFDTSLNSEDTLHLSWRGSARRAAASPQSSPCPVPRCQWLCPAKVFRLSEDSFVKEPCLEGGIEYGVVQDADGEHWHVVARVGFPFKCSSVSIGADLKLGRPAM